MKFHFLFLYYCTYSTFALVANVKVHIVSFQLTVISRNFLSIVGEAPQGSKFYQTMSAALEQSSPTARLRNFTDAYAKFMRECKANAMKIANDSFYANHSMKAAAMSNITEIFKNQKQPPMALDLDATNSTTPASINATISVAQTQSQAACNEMLQTANKLNTNAAQ